MAVRQKYIDDNLLVSAKECFLEKGYLATMLRDVCQRAGVTTGALYKRYKGKEELFDAVVEPAVKKLNEVVGAATQQDVSEYTDEQLIRPWRLSGQGIRQWFDMLEEIRDGFILLVSSKSDGSRYSNFHHEWVQRMTEVDFVYIEEIKKRNLIRQDISKRELHVLLTCFWQLYYEPFIHGFSPEEIAGHCEYIRMLFDWEKILGIGRSE